MKDFFEKNKVPVAIIIAAFIIGGAIWLSRRPISQQQPKQAEPLQPAAKRIDYTKAPNHVGEYACVVGSVDVWFYRSLVQSSDSDTPFT